MERATFAAGCFWGVEAAFLNVPGVASTAVGFMGGHTRNPTYKEVCTDQTGHAEVVDLQFDPTVVSFKELLDVFFGCHNPTTRNRQGPDVGSQYRSAVFYHHVEQRDEALETINKLDKEHRFKASIVTEVVPATPFYRAEEYHQRYYKKNGLAGCAVKE